MTDSAIPDFFQSMISSAVSAVATRRLLTYATMTSVETLSCIRSRIFDFSSAVVSPAAARLDGGGALAGAGAVAAAGSAAGAVGVADAEPDDVVDFFFPNGHHHAIFSSGRFSRPTAASASSAGGSHANASNSTRYQVESVSWQS